MEQLSENEVKARQELGEGRLSLVAGSRERMAMAPLSAPGLTAWLPLRSPDLSCWASTGWETCGLTPGGLTGCCSVLQLQPVLPPGAPVLVSQQDT